jgi:hypothetical protein
MPFLREGDGDGILRDRRNRTGFSCRVVSGGRTQEQLSLVFGHVVVILSHEKEPRLASLNPAAIPDCRQEWGYRTAIWLRLGSGTSEL